MRKTSLVLLVWLASCGGTASDNPPDISGIYDCTMNCSGLCTFLDGLEIEQDGDRIFGQTPFEDMIYTEFEGSINNDGEFSVRGRGISGSEYSCDGRVSSPILTATCEYDDAGFECQTVVYERR